MSFAGFSSFLGAFFSSIFLFSSRETPSTLASGALGCTGFCGCFDFLAFGGL